MSVLTKDQKLFLDIFSKDKDLAGVFYLTGGTALVEFYIPYRYSDDLDFFSETEVNTQSVLISIKKYKKLLKYKSIEFNTSFNRNLFFLDFGDYILKTEFTYFPFPPIERIKNTNGLVVDSSLDIAVNKLFTIYQKPRSRDFMDLYMLNKNYGYNIKDLISKTKSKFDWHIDPIKLGAQFMLVTELKDYPKLIKTLEEKVWQNYFIEQAEDLKKDIFSRSTAQTNKVSFR